MVIDNQNGSIKVSLVITITIKGLPKDVHRGLKQRAEANGRSLNTEVIAVLESSLRSSLVDVDELIARARALRGTMKFTARVGEMRGIQAAGRG